MSVTHCPCGGRSKGLLRGMTIQGNHYETTWSPSALSHPFVGWEIRFPYTKIGKTEKSWHPSSNLSSLEDLEKMIFPTCKWDKLPMVKAFSAEQDIDQAPCRTWPFVRLKRRWISCKSGERRALALRHSGSKYLGCQAYGCGSKNRYQNGTLVSGNMNQNLRDPSFFILSHTHMDPFLEPFSQRNPR